MLIYLSQINLPDSVTKRYAHSMTTFEISNECVWVVVIGGSIKIFDVPITGSDIMVIIELGMTINTHIYYLMY